jgi:xylulokinase
LIFTPWLWGERAPVEDPHLRAGLFNLSLRNKREDLIRAVLEGVAYNTRWLLRPVERFLGRPLTRLSFVGGGARSDLWAQILADVLNVEVRQLMDPIQANARGAAYIAAVGLGEISFDDVPRLVEYRRVYEPQPAHRGVYDRAFREFVALHKGTRASYRRLNV